MNKLNYSKVNSISLIVLLFSILGILIPTQSSIFPSLILSIIQAIIFTFFIIYIFLGIKARKSLVVYLLLYLIVPLIGLFSYPVSAILEGHRFNYYQFNIMGRIVNLTLVATVILFIDSYYQRMKYREIDHLYIAKCYKVGLLTLLLFGVWQLLSFYIPSISYPFETRSHLHSTYGAEYSFTKRLTSISQEPSYFVMFVIDFIALSLLFNRGIKLYLYLILGVIMVVFSLSPSGFITLGGSVLLAWIFANFKYSPIKSKIKLKSILVFTLLLLAMVYFLALNSEILKYVDNRIFGATTGNSGRFYLIVMPFQWAFDSNLFSILFGHGIKSFAVINTYYGNADGSLIAPTTSNNIFTDIFWESGIVGLIALIFFFSYIFLKIIKSNLNKYYLFIALFLYFELIISGIFKSDYATMRFFIILYILFLLPRITDFHIAK